MRGKTNYLMLRSPIIRGVGISCTKKGRKFYNHYFSCVERENDYFFKRVGTVGGNCEYVPGPLDIKLVKKARMFCLNVDRVIASHGVIEYKGNRYMNVFLKDGGFCIEKVNP